jgi:1-acyl-sn-glycerol-3-phosphate acyltransferase
MAGVTTPTTPLMVIFVLIFGPYFPIWVLLSLLLLFLRTSVWITLIVLSAYGFFFFKTQPGALRGRFYRPGFRNSWVWQHTLEWFGFECVLDDCKVDSDRSYILACHPHGVYAWYTLQAVTSEFSPVKRVMQATATATLTLPGIREFAMLFGMVDASRETLAATLKEGTSIAIHIDGEAGSLACYKGFESAVLENRKGFVALALSTGSPIIPAYCFGLSDCYECVHALRPLQKFLHRKFRLGLPLFYALPYVLLPYRRQLTMVYGRPIDVPRVPASEFGAKPDPADVDRVHKEYCDALQQLFDDHKGKYGFEDRELEILDARKPYR